MIKRIFLLLLIPTVCFAQMSPPLSVTEPDGDPIIYNPYEIEFPNGSVVDNEDGTLSIGSVGGEGFVTAVGDCSGGECLDGSSDGGSKIELYQTPGNVSELCFSDTDSGNDTCWKFDGTFLRLYVNNTLQVTYPDGQFNLTDREVPANNIVDSLGNQIVIGG